METAAVETTVPPQSVAESVLSQPNNRTVRPVNDPAVSGYEAWVRPLLKPEVACKIFPGYAETLYRIASRREAMRVADITGPGVAATAGWSPTKQFKLAIEVPYVAALLLKAALGHDALTNPRKRRFIMREHPEFTFALRH